MERRPLRCLDPEDADYREFERFIFDGASLQDIYVESTHGLAARADAGATTSVDQERLRARAQREFGWTQRHLANIADPLDRLHGLEGRRVCDFGCGTGGLSVALALCGAMVVAVDPTMASLRAVRARARFHAVPPDRLRVVNIGSAPGLPFPDQAFDVVVCNSVLEFIPERRPQYVRELVRVVAPGGLLVVSGANGWFPRDYYTGMVLPRLRRAACRRRNLPYGATWLELRAWVRDHGRPLEELTARAGMDSLTKLADRWRRSRQPLAPLAGGARRIARWLARATGVPVDVVLPYATWVFRLDGASGAPRS